MISYSIAAAAVLNAAVGLSAWKLRAVTVNGADAGIVTGMIAYLCGGPLFWFLLFLFFTSSSVLSVLKIKKKIQAEIYYEKTGARDWMQVSANGEPAELIQGFRCISNDAVNALFTIFSAALAMSAFAFFK